MLTVDLHDLLSRSIGRAVDGGTDREALAWDSWHAETDRLASRQRRDAKNAAYPGCCSPELTSWYSAQLDSARESTGCLVWEAMGCFSWRVSDRAGGLWAS